MMEAEYGVGIQNRFAFLDGDDDDERTDVAPMIVPSKPVTAPEKKVPSTTNSRNAGKPENKSATTASSNRNAPKERKAKEQVKEVKEERRANNNNYNRENGGMTGEKSSRQGQGQGSRGRRDGPPPPRRNYRSRAAEDNEIRGEDTEADKAVEDGKNSDGLNDAEADGEKTEGAQDEESENAKNAEKTVTLAEWKALQVPREKPVFNIRKPGEGEVTSKLGKLVLKKREEDIADQDEEYETDDVYYPQRAGKMKLISDVGFTTGYQKRRGGRFASNSARVGGGDGREANPPSDTNVPDRPRGRSRFGFRGGHQRPAPVPRIDIDDASDFPTLG